jgi:hypothetical protein
MTENNHQGKTMSDDQFSLDRVRDRLEIQHRLTQFCRAVDRLDLDALREVFHVDAYDDHGLYKGGVDGFIEYLRNRHKTIEYSSHHLSNIHVEFVDSTNAFVESYFLIWQSVTQESSVFEAGSVEGDSFEVLSSGRYTDHFTFKDGRWAIKSRVVVLGSATRAPDFPAVYDRNFAHFTRDENDPGQQLRRELGLP